MLPNFDLPKLPQMPWSNPPTHVERSHVGRWRLLVTTDRFTGHLTCTLSRSHVRYERRALVFQLPPRLNTFDAAYSVDGGPPVAASSDAMELAHLGFALHDDDLANPSGGLVRIPERRLEDGKVVKIQSRPNVSPITFKIDGFDPALKAARDEGCVDAAFNY
jgi:hypothetical protein